ncbi:MULTISPECIES: SRPBCC family protein [unclassified Nocardiopsis]|uniref:SRPBCC family protein n=1 Tax=unclassified Nocardiopsis TaxID=2649073 RepID=UPI00135CA66B|nr:MULTISPECIES: SRPBCC family protein [unclassified Nocardiopsis]
MGHMEHSVVIDAPYELVWERTNDVASWPELFSRHSSVEILHQEGNTTRFRVVKQDDQGRVWSWVSERTVDPAEGKAWSHRGQLEGFEYVKIHWDFEAVPEGTRLTWSHHFVLKPDAPFTEEQVVAKYQRDLPIEMEEIKNKIEEIAREQMEEAIG